MILYGEANIRKACTYLGDIAYLRCHAEEGEVRHPAANHAACCLTRAFWASGCGHFEVDLFQSLARFHVLHLRHRHRFVSRPGSRASTPQIVIFFENESWFPK